MPLLINLSNQLGGIENLLKLIAIAAGSIWLALNAGKIMGFLKGIPAILKGIRALLSSIKLTTVAMVAVIALIALAIDDLIAFMNGDAAVKDFLGDIWSQNGDKIKNIIDGLIEIIGKIITIL